MSFGLRVAACVIFGVAAFGVAAPVALVPIGLCLWCGSTLVS